MTKNIESLINDYLAPEQPDDCREASHRMLAKALSKHDGPFTHRGQVFSVAEDGTVKAEPAPEDEESPDDDAGNFETPAPDEANPDNPIDITTAPES